MNGWLPYVVAGLIAWPAVPALAAGAAGDGGKVTVISINGAIGPATAEYVSRAVTHSAESQARCLVVELDTPGGLLESTKQIVQAFYASKVPVVVYVSPTGANAGSAGCFITLAADVAAMAPHTSIGAAHPVELGGLGGTAQPSETMEKKVENFAVSYIEAIADKRHRNAEWARSAVRDSASVTAEKALELKVIDLIARDLPELLGQLDGRTVAGAALATRHAAMERLPMLARERVFQLLWRPEVMFILMLIAIYGIISELSNPGAIFPGVAGSIALVLALYMGTVLPVNVAGLALIGLALGLFLIDVFAPTHGVLTAGGVVSFFLGSLLLFDTGGAAFRLSFAVIVPGTVVTALFFVFIVAAGLHAQQLPVRAGRETMIGQVVPALTAIGRDEGKVMLEGETWSARSEAPVAAGRPVEVVGMHGLILHVKPSKPEAS